MRKKIYKLNETQFNYFKRIISFIKAEKPLTIGMQRTAEELYRQLK